MTRQHLGVHLVDWGWGKAAVSEREDPGEDRFWGTLLSSVRDRVSMKARCHV